MIDNLAAQAVTLTVGSGDATSLFSGSIQNTSGAITVTKIGLGKLTLAGSNTYAGLTTISAGTLQLGDGLTANGSVTGNILNNAALAFAPVSGQVYAGQVSGSGSMTMAGPSELTLTGSSTYTGGTTISGGTLQLGDGVSSNGSVSGNIVNNASLGFAPWLRKPMPARSAAMVVC